MKLNTGDLQGFLVMQLIILMFCALYYEVKNIPASVRDCTFEVKGEYLP